MHFDPECNRQMEIGAEQRELASDAEEILTAWLQGSSISFCPDVDLSQVRYGRITLQVAASTVRPLSA